MTRQVRQSDPFWADMLKQVDWYREMAGSEVAEAYVDAIEATLQTLARTPGLGRLRFQAWRELSGLRSWRVEPPYHRHLIFYRFDKETLIAERVLHGARDLPRRLLQSPYEDGWMSIVHQPHNRRKRSPFRECGRHDRRVWRPAERS